MKRAGRAYVRGNAINRRLASRARRLSIETLERRELFDAAGLAVNVLPDPYLSEGEAVVAVSSVTVDDAPVRELEIAFSQPMSIAPMIADGSIRTAVSIVNLNNGARDLSQDSFAYDPVTQTLTWRTATALSPGYYEARLDGSLLSDLGGNLLDGGTGGLAFSLPTYVAAGDVQAGTAALDVDNYSVPILEDWNADGVRDLVVGEKTLAGTGKVRVYLNTGSADAPAFDAFSYAQQDGQDLSVPGSGCLGVFPRIFDWNRDGKKDLVVGLADGRVEIFPNVNTDASPLFGTPGFVQIGQPGAKVDLDVGARAAFDIVDWNNDGHEDLVAGGLDGKVRLYLNQAATGTPEFVSEQILKLGSADLTVSSGRSSVAVADLNRDGRKDLVLGNTEGQLFFFPNVGSDANPEFTGSEKISVDGSALDLPGTPRSRPFIGSFQAGGLPDLWVGEEPGVVHRYAVSAWPTPTTRPIQTGATGSKFTYAFEATVSPWQNPAESLDVTGDSHIAPGDVLVIVNELNVPRWHDTSGRLQTRPQDGTVHVYYDTNGDGYCTPNDALLIINWLNASVSNGEGEAGGAMVSRTGQIAEKGIPPRATDAAISPTSSANSLDLPACCRGNESLPDVDSRSALLAQVDAESSPAHSDVSPNDESLSLESELDQLIASIAADLFRPGT